VAQANDWLQLACMTFVTPRRTITEPLTALAPLYDSEGRYSGFVGVDFDMQYYLMRRHASGPSPSHARRGAALALAIGYAAPSITDDAEACASSMKAQFATA
jgi:hypothetical protein